MEKKDKLRPPWDDYFLKVAGLISSRSTCLRRQVGTIIVVGKRILATGYNGTPQGLLHCVEVGCKRENEGISSGERQELCRGLHAEQNAIIQAALYGISIKGACLYCTHQPCSICAKMIINSEIKRIVIASGYPDKMAQELLSEAGIPIEKR